MDLDPVEQRQLEQALEALRRSVLRFARPGRSIEDWLQDLILDYLLACKRGAPPANVWAWADVVLKHRAARERTRSRSAEALTAELRDPDPPPCDSDEASSPTEQYEVWARIRSAVLEELSDAHRRAMEALPGCQSMHEWERASHLERVDLKRLVDRVAKVARGFLPPS
ncbi:MAG: hypothetical protein JNM84_08085 [Planctomycetes bacterium]|nr:hypothetical protein [Planctomycetota bacterium]